MRISDWSSDVCSSDLDAGHARRRAGRREFHRAAVLQPLELALPRAQAKLAIEGGGAGEVVGERPPAARHVFRIDACLQLLTGGRDRTAPAGDDRGEVAAEPGPAPPPPPFAQALP